MQMKKDWEILRQWAWRISQLVIVLAIASGVAYWNFAAISVVEHKISSGEVIAEVMGTGTLEARVKSTISPKIAGRIHEILVDQGSNVTSGQPLFTLDDAELKQQVEIAQATTAMWQASLARLQADLDQAKAVLDSAQKEFKRTQQLLQSNSISQDEAEKSTERLHIAEAGLARANAALLEGQRQITTSDKTLAFNEARLADTRVSAPFDGLIIKRYRDPGDIGVPGSPILMLASTTEIWVSAWVDETEMSRVHPDQRSRILFRSEPQECFQGTVSRLGREADRETREFVVDVRVESLPKNWAVGQRAEVYIEVERKSNVLLLPTKFIFYRDNQPGVFCKVSDRAIWRPITLGIRGRETIEVSEGVQEGESVCMPATGKNVLLENHRVKVAP
jgi:HlyD family secretion protein